MIHTKEIFTSFDTLWKRELYYIPGIPPGGKSQDAIKEFSKKVYDIVIKDCLITANQKMQDAYNEGYDDCLDRGN